MSPNGRVQYDVLFHPVLIPIRKNKLRTGCVILLFVTFKYIHTSDGTYESLQWCSRMFIYNPKPTVYQLQFKTTDISNFSQFEQLQIL